MTMNLYLALQVLLPTCGHKFKDYLCVSLVQLYRKGHDVLCLLDNIINALLDEGGEAAGKL